MSGEPINEVEARQAAERHGFDWHYREHTESTNLDVLQYHGNYQREVVAVSESQRAGRGRRGRQWHSPLACNLYCTIGISKQIPANRQGLLSIVTGLALCRAIRQSADVAPALKWPNDLLLEGRKLGGILIESRSLDAGHFFFAIGFGLNVHMTAQELAEISQPAVSLAQLAGTVDRTRVLVASIESVIESIRAFEPAAVQDLIDEFARYDAFHGHPIEVIAGDKRVMGINRGITADGQLQLETGQGMQIHSAAEISLRPLSA